MVMTDYLLSRARVDQPLLDPDEEATIEEMPHTARVALRNRLNDLIYRHNVRYHSNGFDPDHKTCGDGCHV
jgi:hypothetical protein